VGLFVFLGWLSGRGLGGSGCGAFWFGCSGLRPVWVSVAVFRVGGEGLAAGGSSNRGCCCLGEVKRRGGVGWRSVCGALSLAFGVALAWGFRRGLATGSLGFVGRLAWATVPKVWRSSLRRQVFPIRSSNPAVKRTRRPLAALKRVFLIGFGVFVWLSLAARLLPLR